LAIAIYAHAFHWGVVATNDLDIPRNQLNSQQIGVFPGRGIIVV
jgi:hypothetical protein